MLSGRLRTQKDRGATSTSHCHARMAPIYSSKFPLNLQLSAGCAENFNPARPNVAKHPNGNSPPKLAGEFPFGLISEPPAVFRVPLRTAFCPCASPEIAGGAACRLRSIRKKRLVRRTWVGPSAHQSPDLFSRFERQNLE